MLRVTMLQRLQIFLIYSPGKYICDHVLIFQTIFFRNICNICIQRAKEYSNYWGFWVLQMVLQMYTNVYKVWGME